MSPILNQAGGLRYHFRGLRHRGRLWQPFRQDLGRWLAEFCPPAPPPGAWLLVAPSGGYCLEPRWLQALAAAGQELHAVDWDPLAPRFFARTHPGVEVHWHRADLMAAGGRELRRLLALLPAAGVLFCNFLGQAELASPREYPAFAAALPALLEGRVWASFHDRYSGQIRPSTLAPLEALTERASPERLLQHFYRSSSSGELNEHELPSLPAGADYSYWPWELRPGVFHLIEGVRSRSGRL